ncbi:universal stress protein [Allopusillimonas ginsengisoli]|uniref:universal stress protein n=1 Tax=Allopusillimonas ginsengisoli TaxID=453575 RepID=UPI0010218433|nr:universal stress protein [Allopusillimonas ginsengisoli]TEA72278.1 universal stress protein [Allopusillimonas ginsengisoli]
MKNFLIPVDGSESSIRALQTAIKMAMSVEGANLHVITVQPPIVSGNVTRFFSAEAIHAYYEEEGRNALAPAQTVLDKSGLSHTVEVVVGPVGISIADYASKHDCDQIIMGTRGKGLVTGLVLGSVSTKVISLSKVPVTLVK